MSLEVKENKTVQFEFEHIDISFIYGYVNYNHRKSKSLEPPIESGFKKMWAPIYNLNCSAYVIDNQEYPEQKRPTDGFCLQDLITKHPIKIILKSDKDNQKVIIPAELSAHILRKRFDEKLWKNLDDKNNRETDGGPGSLTIKISIKKSQVDAFNIDAIILDILQLVPRYSESEKKFEIEGLENFFKPLISDKVSTNFSPIYQLFCNLLYENQKCWSELFIPPDKGCANPRCNQCATFYPFYDFTSKIDPQIPYMVLEGFLPKDVYEKGYMSKGRDNSKYTNEIACLMGRWLDSNNIADIDRNYYRHNNDSEKIIKKDGKDSFISQFRDKKTFIIFSSLLSLILKCKHNDDVKDKVVELTTNSVISYHEFSRIRLHHALWLNKQLDKIVDEVGEQKTTKEILVSKNKLNTLKVTVAKSMNNPISYMWDSVLSQEIPSLKINRNVEKLENDTIQKLNLISELISGKIQNSQISDFVEAVERKGL